MINYNLFLEEDKHLRVRSNPLPTVANKLWSPTKKVKCSPVTKATSVCDGDANQQLLVCLCYDADKGLFSLLSRKNRTERKCSTLRATSHGLLLPMKLEMMNIPISACFYKQRQNFYIRPSTLQVCAMTYTTFFKTKVGLWR